MSAASIRDKVAAKLLTLHASTRPVFVYSNASTDATLAQWPPETPDVGAVHAFVGRGTTTRTGGTGTQRVERFFNVEFRFSALDKAEAERLMDEFEDEIVTEFSQGITLDGSAIECTYTGADAPFELEDEETRLWVVWVAHFRVLERSALEMTA